MAAALLVINFLAGVPTLAENIGDAGVISRETDLRSEPKEDGVSQGILPRGTVISIRGEKQGRFVPIAVELEDGKAEGFVVETALGKSQSAATSSKAEEPANGTKKRTREKKKRAPTVPRDEEALLRREPSFSYGVLIGSHYSLLSVEDLPDETFSGMGLSVGGHLSFFLDPTFRIRVESAYTTHGGMISDGTSIGFGFLDVGVLGEFLFQPSFLLFGGLQYSFGAGIRELPNTINITSATDLNSFWIQLGAGYRFKLGDMTYLALRGRYLGSLAVSPIQFYSFGLAAYLEIQG